MIYGIIGYSNKRIWNVGTSTNNESCPTKKNISGGITELR